jgi:hypothetical protein
MRTQIKLAYGIATAAVTHGASTLGPVVGVQDPIPIANPQANFPF